MKKITVLFMIFAISLCLFGCDNAQTENKNYDADIVADALNSQLEFGEALEKSTADALYSIYNINPGLCTNAAFYAGSGATADEIAVFNCIDSESASSVKDAVDARLKYLSDGYSNYGPDQVPRINSAAVIAKGNTLIMCICNNPESAEAVVDSAAQ